jgi:signal transduction histidine kinase
VKKGAKIGTAGSMTAGYLLTLAALLASTFITFRSAQAQVDLEGWVIHTHEVMTRLEGVRSAISEAENGQRGYIITGSDEYMQEYRSDTREATDDLDAVARLTADNPEQQKRVELLRQAVARRVEVMQRSIAARRTNDVAKAEAVVASGERRPIMREIRGTIAAMEGEETQLLNRRRREAVRGRQTFLVGLTVGSVAGILLLSGLYFFVHRLLSEQNARRRDAARHLNELEGKVRERTSELSALNQNLESFSYSVSHDLRGPLRNIGAQAALLEEDLPELTEEQREGLSGIRRSVKRMGGLMDDLLKLSRSTRGEMRREAVDLSGLACKALDEVALRHPRPDVTIKVEEGMVVQADSAMVTILLDNLIRNAWKYSANTPNAVIEIGRENEAFYVRDNGLGFDDSQFEEALEPFRRLPSGAEFEGSGIGLSICNRVVQRHGGRLWAKSQPGQGATIYFTLE